MNPNVIVVNIPAQNYSTNVYVDNENCYLATALKKAGFKNVRVCAVGISVINGDEYIPFDHFGGNLLRKAFRGGKDVTVILLKV